MAMAKIKWQRSPPLPAALVPPNLADLGPVEFTAQDYEQLAEWLGQEGWPRDCMDIATLEGYLVAMIMWPIELSPGAWLPSIWGIRGWKVAAKIAAHDEYQRFVRLIVGFRQRLANELNVDSQAFSVSLTHRLITSKNPQAAVSWAQGFLLALYEGSQGYDWRTDEVTTAVQLVVDSVQHVSGEDAKSPELIAAQVGAVVLTIVSDRNSGRANATGRPRPVRPFH